ncbi:MAG TPA: ABC transporter ATP-binding protein [Myxococcota bacterium]|nr:ABC transporter ATP-binding protein [Myxococcota bacterium]
MRGLLRLVPYYRRHRGELWAGLALLLLARLFEALIPQLLRVGIDGIAKGSAALGLLAVGIGVCVAVQFATIWFGRRTVRKLGVEVAYDLRNLLYEHLQKQGPAFFARHRTGDLMARAINDIGLIRRVVALGTRTVVVLVFSSAVAFSCMAWQSPRLTLWLLPPMPLVFGAAYLLSRRLYRESLHVQQGFATLSDRVQENLGGIRTIQALNQEEEEIRRFDADNLRYLAQNFRLLRTNSLLAALMPAFGALSVLVVLGFGGRQVLAGEMSLGTFTSFVWYLNMVLWPVREAGNMINLFQRGAAGCDRVFELLDTPPEIEDRPDPRAPERVRGALELRAVDYRYRGGAERALALCDISLRVEAGETLAVLGRIGAGKTTFLHLLVRLLDPPPGAVRLDGVDVRAFALGDLRRHVALVPQEPFLFSESVRDNLSYDDPGRALAALESAAAAADFAETVARFPNGWDTEVGERGVLLSGGQKQRLTLARALVRDAPVLLLDDPFSSVDAETEERILQRLLELRRGRTTVIVTHRVSAARTAHRVIVLEHGRVMESGEPGELLARGGAYAEIARAQRRSEALRRDLATGEEQESGGEAA